MKVRLLLLALFLSGCANHGAGLARLQEAAHYARWEPASMLRADFDCDGVEDAGLLGQQAGDIVVGVAPGSGAPPEILQFAISGSRQDGICNVPAKLQLNSLATDPSSAVGPLKGFRRSDTCPGLRLTGPSECDDEILLYWNH